MKKIDDNITKIYFLGIGGIGMSALARYFKAQGYDVAGYDLTPSPLTEKMSNIENISINYVDSLDSIEEKYRDSNTTLLIVTPAIPYSNKQLNYFISKGFKAYKRAEVLGMLSKEYKAICVAGTHGKTTVSTLTSHLISNSKIGCTAFVGGISINTGTNLIINKESKYIVVEADEYDRSFLHLNPYISVITSMSPDHLDIYGDYGNMQKAFLQFADNVEAGGSLYIKRGLNIDNTRLKGYYDIDGGDYYAENIRYNGVSSTFDYNGHGLIIKDLILNIPGKVNVENAVAAITMAIDAGVSPKEISDSLPIFKGIQRRFQIHLNDNNIYIDDYAHHPEEINAVLNSIKQIWADKNIVVVFQPHLYTRTKDFYKDFAKSLDIADEIYLLDIYPAREEKITGVSSLLIAKEMKKKVSIISKEEVLLKALPDRNGDIIVTMGAGDIDRLIPSIIQFLSE